MLYDNKGSVNVIVDVFEKKTKFGRQSKKFQFQGAQILRKETCLWSCRNDEGYSATQKMDFLRSRQMVIL